MTENGPGGTPRDENEPQQPPAGAVPPPPGAYPPPPAGYEPPAASYPPPPPGSYPPPPGGGYGPPGAMPPAPQPYGAPGGPQAVGIGEAFNYGWTKFTANVGPILLAVLVYGAVIAIVGGIFYGLLVASAVASANNDPYRTSSGMFGAGIGFGTIVFYVVIILLGYLAQAGMVRGALHVTYGRPLEFKTFFQFDNLGGVIGASLLIGLGTGVGMVLCIIPGIVFAFFAQFALYFVLDKQQGAVEAIRSSFSLVNKNLGTVVVLFLAVYVVQAIGFMLCGIGQLIAFPLTMIATAYLYRRMLGEPVAP
ncbi:MAG TPA: hypothetical protein VMV41_06955 [Cellulomonadaceae bacterium]|nr:hypothetical protein [Cellulomonadaceae bacterium]